MGLLVCIDSIKLMPHFFFKTILIAIVSVNSDISNPRTWGRLMYSFTTIYSQPMHISCTYNLFLSIIIVKFLIKELLITRLKKIHLLVLWSQFSRKYIEYHCWRTWSAPIISQFKISCAVFILFFLLNILCSVLLSNV